MAAVQCKNHGQHLGPKAVRDVVQKMEEWKTELQKNPGGVDEIEFFLILTETGTGAKDFVQLLQANMQNVSGIHVSGFDLAMALSPAMQTRSLREVQLDMTRNPSTPSTF